MNITRFCVSRWLRLHSYYNPDNLIGCSLQVEALGLRDQHWMLGLKNLINRFADKADFAVATFLLGHADGLWAGFEVAIRGTSGHQTRLRKPPAQINQVCPDNAPSRFLT